MRIPAIFQAVVVCFAASIGVGYAVADDAVASKVQQQVIAADAWLVANPAQAPAMRELLAWDALKAAIAKADRAKLVDALAKLGSGKPGTEAAPLVALRDGLIEWLAAQPAPDAAELPSVARGAKAAFLTYTPGDVDAAKGRLTAAVERLETRFQAAGKTADGWREYLAFDGLKQQMARPEGPQSAALETARVRLSAGYEGLRLTAFTDVRDTARRYLLVSRSKGDAKVRAQYEAILEELAKQLELYAQKPTAENVYRVNLRLEWLDLTGQGRWVAAAVRQRLSRPNVMASVSSNLVSSRASMPIDDVTDVSETILGTPMQGTGHTVGMVTAQLLPAGDAARIELLFRGTVDTETIGSKGPVRVLTTGTADLRARKLLRVDDKRIESEPAESSADVSTTIQNVWSVRGGTMIEKFARRRAEKIKPQAEAIAAGRTEARFNERMDAQAEEMIAKANKSIDEKIRNPLLARSLFPSVLKFASDPKAFSATAQIDCGGFLAAPNEPPAVEESADVFVRVHDSAINNFAASALGGMMVEEKRFQKILTETFGLPERIETQGDDENWTITYAQRQPIAVSFGEDTFSVTVAGREYAKNESEVRKIEMNVTAVYKIQKTDHGYKAVRQGKLAVFPPGFKPESGKQLGAQQQALRTVLERRFERFLSAEIAPKNIVAEVEGKEPLELTLTHWRTTRGWLAIGWKMVPPSQTKPKDKPGEKPAKTAAKGRVRIALVDKPAEPVIKK